MPILGAVAAYRAIKIALGDTKSCRRASCTRKTTEYLHIGIGTLSSKQLSIRDATHQRKSACSHGARRAECWSWDPRRRWFTTFVHLLPDEHEQRRLIAKSKPSMTRGPCRHSRPYHQPPNQSGSRGSGVREPRPPLCVGTQPGPSSTAQVVRRSQPEVFWTMIGP